MADYIGTVFGYGGATCQNVLMVDFSHPLSSKVTYECYDNDQTFPATDTATTTSNEIFGISGGTTMIQLIDLTNATTNLGTTWLLPLASAYQANSGKRNLMKGLLGYVTQQGATLQSAGGGSIKFNMRLRIPSDMETSHNGQWDLLVRYSYTSTIPTVQWWFNDKYGSKAASVGTADVPAWATMVPDIHGLRHTRAGVATLGATSWLANIPESGSELTEEAHVTT